jgi:hypothetical protein
LRGRPSNVRPGHREPKRRPIVEAGIERD